MSSSAIPNGDNSKKHARSPSPADDSYLTHPTPKRAREIDSHDPLTELESITSSLATDSTRNILHWFRGKDLRVTDNTGLYSASRLLESSKKENEKGRLITLFLYSPKDLDWHGTSPARADFMLETLRDMRDELKELNIPLYIITVPERDQKIERLSDFVEKYNVSHVFANLEYEVDELRRDVDFAKICKDKKINFEVEHDQTVIKPGELKTKGGGPHKVFTPYHKAWLERIREEPGLLNTVPAPAKNDDSAKNELKELFDCEIPFMPESKQTLDGEEKEKLRKLWPRGHKGGMDRLNHFLTDKVSDYAATRSNPAKDSSSRMSVYFSSGAVSTRQALSAARKANKNQPFDSESGDKGIASWTREICFREFYRHILSFIPHNSMNLPQNLKFEYVNWEDDHDGWEKWYKGTTGVPFIDAGMRQLNTEKWMHNRLRMNTASYLRTNLLIDYRKGERYFAETLIDWDLASNTQGWEPNYTVFNPVSQAEKCDPNGDYIRKWVPELKEVKGKAVFSPHDRLSKEDFEKLGYPKPHVEFSESKRRALDRYKQDMADIH